MLRWRDENTRLLLGNYGPREAKSKEIKRFGPAKLMSQLGHSEGEFSQFIYDGLTKTYTFRLKVGPGGRFITERLADIPETK